ncbi:hypothetical protein R3P38DRAFT_3522446 [Favolaschia claudopus]|uniref:Uncharacterized protein n=1 Tax=Favolaschia claudopus TaxID=2862362 RepID=A0AAW0E264_9AGAR
MFIDEKQKKSPQFAGIPFEPYGTISVLTVFKSPPPFVIALVICPANPVGITVEQWASAPMHCNVLVVVRTPKVPGRRSGGKAVVVCEPNITDVEAREDIAKHIIHNRVLDMLKHMKRSSSQVWVNNKREECEPLPAMWKGMAKTNRAAIYLELYIDVSAFHLRSSGEDDLSSALVSSRRKRALSSTSGGANRDYEATKRRNPSMGPLKSMFVPTSSSAIVVHKVSPVTLKKTICTADNITGVPEFEEAEIEVSGVIRDTHFAKGGMKYAFEFETSHGEALVAKRFYRLEDTDSPSSSVAVLDNKEEIILELCRLLRNLFESSIRKFMCSQIVLPI